MVAVMATRGGARNYPGMAAAVVVGLILYTVGFAVGSWQKWAVTPLPGMEVLAQVDRHLPANFWTIPWWTEVWWKALEMLPLTLPFGLATVIGGIECTESAEAAGDTYDTRSILLGQGMATIATGLCGGVIQPHSLFPVTRPTKRYGAHIGYPLGDGPGPGFAAAVFFGRGSGVTYLGASNRFVSGDRLCRPPDRFPFPSRRFLSAITPRWPGRRYR